MNKNYLCSRIVLIWFEFMLQALPSQCLKIFPNFPLKLVPCGMMERLVPWFNINNLTSLTNRLLVMSSHWQPYHKSHRYRMSWSQASMISSYFVHLIKLQVYSNYEKVKWLKIFFSFDPRDFSKCWYISW